MSEVKAAHIIPDIYLRIFSPYFWLFIFIHPHLATMLRPISLLPTPFTHDSGDRVS